MEISVTFNSQIFTFPLMRFNLLQGTFDIPEFYSNEIDVFLIPFLESFLITLLAERLRPVIPKRDLSLN